MVKGVAIRGLAIVLVAAVGGCASTKNVMNKATFGMVGESDPDAQAAKDRQKADKQAAKQAKKDQKAAEKAAKQEANAAESDEGGRSLTNKMTFGLVGEDDPAAVEQKRAEKEAKRQAEQDREAEKRAAKQEKKAAKQQAEADKKAAKQAEKEAEATETADASEPAAEMAETNESERGWLNKATFGMAGGKDPAKQEAKAQAKADKKAAKQAKEEEKRAAKEAKHQEKEAAKADEQMAEAETAAPEEEKPKRGFLSKATFGLVGGGKEDSEEPVAEMETADAEPVNADAAPVEAEGPLAEADSTGDTEAAATEPAEDDPKRPLLSKMTFGLAGGSEEDWAAKAETEEQQAARRDAINEIPKEARKLAEEKFETSIAYEPNSAGRTMGIANRVSYSKHGYGITDLGNARIAVEGMTFDGTWRSGGMVVDSTERGALSGRAGTGNRMFGYEYVNGTTTFTFGSVTFAVTQGVLEIGGQQVPIKDGRKLILVSPQGTVQGVYDIGPAN